jgi:hypothetical protein
MFQVFFCNGHTDKANVRKTKTKIKFSWKKKYLVDLSSLQKIVVVVVFCLKKENVLEFKCFFFQPKQNLMAFQTNLIKLLRSF